MHICLVKISELHMKDKHQILNPKICNEPLEIPNSQSNLRNIKVGNITLLILNCITKL